MTPKMRGGGCCACRITRTRYLLFFLCALGLYVWHSFPQFSSSTPVCAPGSSCGGVSSFSLLSYSTSQLLLQQQQQQQPQQPQQELLVSPSPPPFCSVGLGRGSFFYESQPRRVVLAGLGSGDGGPPPPPQAKSRCFVGSCPEQLSYAAKYVCQVQHLGEGRTGNQLVNYFAGRLYAELHSCASSPVTFGDGLGVEGGFPPQWQSWPNWLASKPGHFGEALDGTLDPTALRRLYEVGSARSLVLKSQVERADVLYAAASMGWDLAGETLVGRGLNAIAEVALGDAALVGRCGAWAREREACWDDPEGRALHPWMPVDMRELAVWAIGAASSGGGGGSSKGSSSSSSATASGSGGGDAPTTALLPPGLAAVAEDPEGTLVIHARLGDMSAMAWQEAQANAGEGHSGVWGESGSGGVGWQWTPEKFPRYRYPKFPDCDKLREEGEYSSGEGRGMLDALEWDAARLGGFVVSPFSFYRAVLEGTAGSWKRVVILTEPCSRDHPVIRAIIAYLGGLGNGNGSGSASSSPPPVIVQSGSVVEDLTTMALARQLVISSSTFSFMAALMGRAKVIHVPYAGSFSLRGAHNRQCLTPTYDMDPRFVYHDVYRRAVDAVALALDGKGNDKWMWRREGAGPLPVRPSTCPASGGGGGKGQKMAVGGAHAWANSFSNASFTATRDGGTEGGGVKGLKVRPRHPTLANGKQQQQQQQPIPYYFLTWEELSSFYRNPACGSYYYPPATTEVKEEQDAYVQRFGSYPLCTDTEWTFFTGERRDAVKPISS